MPTHLGSIKISLNLMGGVPKAIILVTMPMLEVAFEVINAWGFKYKTCAFTWVKTNKNNTIYMGMGRYTRANAEICLLATKGKGLPRKNASIKNTHLLPRTRHSEKPDLFRNMITELFGIVPFEREGKLIELFARNKTFGWDVFGNEVESDIDLSVIK